MLKNKPPMTNAAGRGTGAILQQAAAKLIRPATLPRVAR
jgi:hypothetical protein